MNKKLTIIIAAYLMICQVFAQHKSLSKHTANNWKSFKAEHQEPAKQLAQNKTALLLSDQDALQLIASTKDELNYQQYRYQQSYKGIPIEGAIYIMHEKEGKVKLSNGSLVTQLNINTQPSLSEAVALQLAIEHTPAKLYAWQSKVHEKALKEKKRNEQASYLPKGRLTIVDPQFSQNANNYRLAYKFQVFAVEPFIQNEVYIDAHNGEIVLAINTIHQCTESTINVPTNYSGDVEVSICKDDNESTQLKSSQYGGLEVRDFTDNNLINIEDRLATEVLWATENTFDYFKTHHNLNMDDSVTVSKINYSGDFFGAFYLSQQGEVVYCDGNETTHNAYTTSDIVGHELTHGLNKFSANLINRYESGALNESFADIFGALIEAHCLGSTDWIFGDKVSPTNNGLRNLAKPKDESMKTQQPDTYLGENWIIPSSVCIKNNDYCGVHRNSGVQNYWFYLLAEGGTGTNDNGFNYNLLGIGKEKAARIAYRNLTAYLTPSATYIDARQGSIQAAIDLFGVNSFEEKQTRDAWQAVGVTHNPINIKLFNEIILSNNTFQFELQVDSLNQMMRADGLTIRLDVQNNYDIISIELMHPDLQAEDVNLKNNEIFVNRINTQPLNTQESLVKITAELKPGVNSTTFEIQGGTFTHHSGFIPFEDVVFDIPFNNCSDEKGLVNWLPLTTSINYETCTEAASVVVKIAANKNAPYAHIWTNNDTIFYQYAGYEKQIEVPNLQAGMYQVTVNDTDGNCTSLEVKIPLLANRDGNNFCGNRCPEYLVTSAGNLQGTYNAKVELEVRGFINEHQNASFNICN